MSRPPLRSVATPWLGALMLLAAVISGRATDENVLEQRFKEANAKLDAGENKPALEIYNEILEAEPKAGNVWVMRAIAKWILEDRSGARADLAQAITLHPDNADAYRVRGQFRYQAEDYAGSLADFTQAIDLTAEQPNAELFGMRAEVEKKLEDRPAALHDLDRAIELKPDYVAALFLRGQIHEAEQQPGEAERDYTKVIELKPQHADALVNRAWIRFHDLKWDEAIADGQQALAIAPKAAAALRVVGYAQFAREDYAAAAGTLGEAATVEPGPDGAYALFIRHHALLRTARKADARLATSWGAWKDAPWVQAIARFVTGQITEDELEVAAKDTADSGELSGRSCEMHFYIGLARRQAGDKSTARLRFQATLNEHQPTYVEDALARAELKRS